MNPLKASDDIIVQEVAIKRPAAKIFNALTDPAELARWWRVEDKFRVTHMESDFRPGGKWRMRLIGGGKTESAVRGEFRQIEPPRLLVFTWIREQEDPTETLVRWELEEKDGVTTVRVTHSGLKTESLRRRNDGWPMILGLLRAHMEKAK